MISVAMVEGGTFFFIKTENVVITVFSTLVQMLRKQKGSVTCTGVGVDCIASPETWIGQNSTVLEKRSFITVLCSLL